MTEQLSPEVISNALHEYFPQEAHKSRQGGGGSFTYVEGHTVVNRLNKATGNSWDFDIDDWQIKEVAGQTFVIARGTLVIPGLGSRSDIGTCKIIPDKNGNVSEESFKAASTDCLKRCARLFGVALYLYGEDYEDGDHAPLDYTNAGVPTGPSYSQPVHVDERRGGGGRKITERQVDFVYKLAHDRGLTDEGLNRWVREVYGSDVEQLEGQSASNLIERLKDQNVVIGGGASAPQRQAAQNRSGGGIGSLGGSPPSNQGNNAQATNQGSGEGQPAPITERQSGAIYGIAKNELQIDADGDQFNDICVLHWGAPWKELSSRDASALIKAMKEDPASLDATQLPKNARLGAPAMRYWLRRISESQGEGEAQEIYQAMKNRYSAMNPEHMTALAEALAKWNIGVAA